MADERLRRLYRQAVQSGGVNAQAHLLLERVRTGDLHHDMLRLAAFLEHEPARIAIDWGSETSFTHLDFEPVKKWVEEGLAIFGETVLRRAALAVARLVLPICQRRLPRDNRARLTIIAKEKFLAANDQDKDNCAVRVREAGGRIPGLIVQLVDHEMDPTNRALRATCAINYAASTITNSVSSSWNTFRTIREARSALTITQIGDSRTAAPSRDRIALRSTYLTIQEELLPWALGESDPILDNPTPAEPPSPEGTD